MTTEEKLEPEVAQLKKGIRLVLDYLRYNDSADDAYRRKEAAAQDLAEAIWMSKTDIGKRGEEACEKEYREWREARHCIETIDTSRAALGGLQGPGRVKRAWDEYRTESDTLGEFIDEYVHVEPLGLRDLFMPSAVIFKVYCAWCQQQGEKPESQIALSKAIMKKFRVESETSHNERGFRGLSVDNSAKDY